MQNSRQKTVADLVALLTEAGVDFSLCADPGWSVDAPVDWGDFSGSGLAFYIGNDLQSVKQWQDETDCLLICNGEMRDSLDSGPYLFTETPRKAFAVACGSFLEPAERTIHPTAFVDPQVEVGEGLAVGPFSSVGKATIGDNVTIGAHVTITDNVIIDDNATIMDGARIGVDGLGSKMDTGELRLFPHFSRACIGRNSVVGCNSVVARGVLGPTVVGDGTHLSMLCSIGHGAVLGRSVFCAPGVLIAGRAKIMDNCFLGQGCSVKEGATLHEGTTVGSNVAISRSTKRPGETLMGNPPKSIGSMFGHGRKKSE